MLCLFREAETLDPSRPLQFLDGLCWIHVIHVRSTPNHISEKVSFCTFQTNCCLSFCKASSGTNLVASPWVYTSTALEHFCIFSTTLSSYSISTLSLLNLVKVENNTLDFSCSNFSCLYSLFIKSLKAVTLTMCIPMSLEWPAFFILSHAAITGMDRVGCWDGALRMLDCELL